MILFRIFQPSDILSFLPSVLVLLLYEMGISLIELFIDTRFDAISTSMSNPTELVNSKDRSDL